MEEVTTEGVAIGAIAKKGRGHSFGSGDPVEASWEPDYVALLNGAIGGDRRCWDELLARLNPLVRSVVARYRLDPEAAADVVQTVWIRLFENAALIRDPTRLPGWLSATSRNESLNRIEQLRRLGPTCSVEEWADSAPAPDEFLIAAEVRRDVRRAFDALPNEARTLLALTFQRPRLSYAEIADRVGRPIGSIGPTRARCLSLLRAELQLLGRDGWL